MLLRSLTDHEFMEDLPKLKDISQGFLRSLWYPVPSLILFVMPFSPHGGPFCSPELFSASVFLCLFIPSSCSAQPYQLLLTYLQIYWLSLPFEAL